LLGPNVENTSDKNVFNINVAVVCALYACICIM